MKYIYDINNSMLKIGIKNMMMMLYMPQPQNSTQNLTTPRKETQ